jgi:hypothetical protein
VPKALPLDTRAHRPAAFVAPDGVVLIDILDLGVGHCRWPFDTPKGTRYCGRRTVGPYCDDHDRVAHAPSGARRSRDPGLGASDA